MVHAAGCFPVGGDETPGGAGQVLGHSDQWGLVDHHQAELPRPVSDFQSVVHNPVSARFRQGRPIVFAAASHECFRETAATRVFCVKPGNEMVPSGCATWEPFS